LLRCLESIRLQTYSNIQVLFVDDDSDYSREYKKNILAFFDKDDVVIWRKERAFSLKNAYELIHEYCEQEDAVVFNLDADDWLYSNESIKTLMNLYMLHDWYFSYGDCFIWSGSDEQQILASKLGEHNKKYPKDVSTARSFRDYPFLPLHPRTWKVHAFKSISKESFLNKRGDWLQYCEDQAIFFPLLEMYFTKCGVVSQPLSVYNVENPNSDSKIELISSLNDELEIRGKQRYEAQDN
jgi:glycosyltransferase involved in cell wall biosynthesis